MTGPAHDRSFSEALTCAVRGLGQAARTQRHFRAQLAIGAAALLFAAWAHASTVELAVLALTVALVLGAELLNTGVELLTDLLHPDYGPDAAVVKDVAAAAVLVAAVLALAVGLLILLPHIITVPPNAVRGIPTALGVLCLLVFVFGAVRRRRIHQPGSVRGRVL